MTLAIALRLRLGPVLRSGGGSSATGFKWYFWFCMIISWYCAERSLVMWLKLEARIFRHVGGRRSKLAIPSRLESPGKNRLFVGVTTVRMRKRLGWLTGPTQARITSNCSVVAPGKMHKPSLSSFTHALHFWLERIPLIPSTSEILKTGIMSERRRQQTPNSATPPRVIRPLGRL